MNYVNKLDKPPTEEGFYYFRHKGADRNHIWFAQVVNTRGSGLHVTVFASLEIHRIEHKPLHIVKGDWYGPLPKPQL